MLLQVEQDSGIVPKALETRPILKTKWRYPFEIYVMLSGSRRYSMSGAASIPLSEFVAFVSLFQISAWHAWQLWEEVRLIDRLTLSARAEAAKAKQTKK